jgi:hypothetical protein
MIKNVCSWHHDDDRGAPKIELNVLTSWKQGGTGGGSSQGLVAFT